MRVGFWGKNFPVVAVVILLIIPNLVQGQYRYTERSNYGIKSRSYIVYGIKFGPSLNQFTQPGSFIGLNAGIFAKYKINDSFDVLAEGLYSMQGGGRQNYTKIYDDADQSRFVVNSITNINPFVVFHNFEIPLLAEFGFPELSRLSIQPRFRFGGSYSRVISAFETKTQRYNYSDGSAVDIGYIREDVANRYRKNQFALIASVGLDFKTAKRTFFVEARYRQGLTQLNKYTYVAPGTGDVLFSSSLIFNTGITL